MTVKEGEPIRYAGPYPMSKLCPVLTSSYYHHLIHDKSNNNCVQPWDLMMGINSLSDTIASLKKALDKKNGVYVPEIDTKDMYHMQIDP